MIRGRAFFHPTHQGIIELLRRWLAGAVLIATAMRPPLRAFDDFASVAQDDELNRRLLVGLHLR